MDIDAMLKDLREQLAHVNDSIVAIQRLAVGSHGRRGRPPNWLAEVKEIEAPKKRGRPQGSRNKRTVAGEDRG